MRDKGKKKNPPPPFCPEEKSSSERRSWKKRKSIKIRFLLGRRKRRKAVLHQKKGRGAILSFGKEEEPQRHP